MAKNYYITLTDGYSGRSIRLRFMPSLEKYDSIDQWLEEHERWSWLTDGQRKRIESFFGKMNAYHTSISL